MKPCSYRTILIGFTLSMITFSLFACAIFQQKAPDEDLKVRVEGMMTAKINNDWGKIYTYFESSFRKKETKDDFTNKKRGIKFTKYMIDSIKIAQTGKEATVKVEYDFNMRGFDFKNNLEVQNWAQEEGRWYLRIPN